ncbi:MAG: CBS domain-containing protein, partial [Polyangiaceae bacterium]|nr:CBS domain-containing protein [Polyangiaceae bacterium]
MTPHALEAQPIESLMTFLPRMVEVGVDVGSASELMQELRVHHLPVVDRGELIGVVSARDLDVVSAIRAGHASKMTVAEVLIGEPATADANEPLSQVVGKMAESGSDHCVILRDGLAVGIVTHSDIVDAFLRVVGVEARLPGPEAIRERILHEHERIRSLLDHMEALAGRLANGERKVASRLRRWARELAIALRGHLALEEEILLPAIRDADAFGNARAEELLGEHEAQRELLSRVTGDLCSTTSDT